MTKIKVSTTILILIITLPLSAQHKIDSLENDLKVANEAQKAEIYYLLAEEYFAEENYDAAFDYYIKSAEQSLKYIDTSYYYVMGGYGNAGYILNEEAEYIKAIEYFQLSLKYAQLAKDNLEVATAFMNLGNAYIKMGNYEKAAFYFEKTLETDLESGNHTYLSTDYNSLGKLYELWQKYDISLEYFKKAFAIDSKENNKEKMAIRLNSIGVNYRNLHQFDSAIFYINKALKIEMEQGDEKKIAIRYSNLGSVYTLTKDYEKATDYYLKAIKLFEKHNVNYSLCITYNEYAGLLFEKKQYAESAIFSEKSIAIASEIKYNLMLLENYRRLSLLNEIQKKYLPALDNYKKYAEIKDSIFSEKSMQSINNLEIKYETEKLENENINLKNESKIKDLTLQRRQILLFAFISIALLVIILAFILYKRIKLKNRVNQILSEKNHQLEILNATKDKFFGIISHDLRNPLSAFKNITSSLESNINEISKDEIKYFVSELSSSSLSLYELLQSLLLWAQTQSSTIQCKLKEINLLEAVKNTINLFELNIYEKNLKITLDLDKDMAVMADVEMLQAILRNLVSNAIKFTPVYGEIKLLSESAGNMTIVSIQDTGIGMSKADLDKLFKINVDVKSIGNSSEKGAGLGLIICKEMLEKCGGKIFAESEQGKGTIFKFTLSKARS